MNDEKKELLEKLVESICKKYDNRGVSYEELLEAGRSQIPMILNRYKGKDINLKFDNIPTWFIRQAITRKVIETNYED